MNALADRDFCAALVISLGHFLWQGALIAGVVALVARRLKTANARCNVLVAAFCLMAISPFVTLGVRYVVSENDPPSTVAEIPPLAANSHVADLERLPAQSTGSLVPVDGPPEGQLAQLPVVAPIPTAPPIKSSANNGWQRFAPLMMNVYLLGVAAMLLRLVVGVWGGWRLRHRSTPVEEVALVQALRRQAQSLGMKCVPVLAWCENVAVPTVIGILKPTILLPLSLTSGLAADQVESVLAHELAHLRRYDHLVNLFQRVVESLLFFHPAVWWLSNRIRVEREHCCDDMVVACGAVPLDYAKSLLRVAELSRLSRRNRSVSAVSLLATGQPSTLRQRIARLLGDATDTHVRFLHRWPAILLATLCLLVAWTTTRVGWGLPPNADEQPAPFVAELPGGFKVEVLSIGYHQTLFKKWWAADGTVLPAEPRDPKLKRVAFSSFTSRSSQGEAREIAVRITGIPKQETLFGYQFCWEPYGDAVDHAVVYEPSEFTSALMPLVSQLKDKKVSLRVCIDPLPEEIVRSISADGTKKLGSDPISEVLRRVDALMQPIRVEKVQDQTELLLKPVNRGAGPPIDETVPVAIDKVGGRHGSIQAGGREGFFTYRYPIAVSEIARFEYRLKPYRHWVTFSNLSVYPGEKTDVQVKVESLAGTEDKVVSHQGRVPTPNVKSLDWPQWGGSIHRNNVAFGQTVPARWNLETLENVKWSAPLGDQTYSSPIIANGKVFIGTNNAHGYVKEHPATDDLGCLLAFDEQSGRFLWQASNLKLPAGRTEDWPLIGLCSSVYCEGSQVWYVTNRAEVMCLDAEGFQDNGENDGPVTDERLKGDQHADTVWRFDCMKTLGIKPFHMAHCSLTCLGDRLFLVVSHGVDESHRAVTNPKAACFACLDKRSGELLWSDSSASANILECQWSSPCVFEAGGQTQVVMGAGDGWVYSYDPAGDGKGHGKLLWKFDTNPKASVFAVGQKSVRNYCVGTPVFSDGYVYVANGRNPEQGEGLGQLYCIDPTKRGDVSLELAVDANGSVLPARRGLAVDAAQGEKAIANPNSAAVWTYSGVQHLAAKHAFDATFHRTIGSVAVSDNLLFVADFSGLLHCLDARKTVGGKPVVYWTHDLMSPCWSTPLIADGKVYVGDEDGEVSIFKLSSNKTLIAEQRFDSRIYSTLAAANNTLFVASQNRLIALATGQGESRKDVGQSTDPDGKKTEAANSTPPKSEPQSQYQTATYLQEKISAKIPDAAWGKPNKGLRLAMVIREESRPDWNELPAGTRVPGSWALRPGDQILSQLIVENVSDKPINLTGYTYTEVDRSLAVFDREQKELSTNSTHISIPALPTSWKLLPGERYLLQMPPITFLDEKSEHRGIGYYVQTPPGEYTIRCGYAFGQRGKDDPRPAPDPLEWTGVLQAGDIKITVDDPNDKTASRVRRGQDALDRIDQFKPAWGELRSGVQMGLARLGETDKFHAGQRVPLEFYLRNVGKQTAKVRFHVEFYSDVPTVRDADGKEVKVALIHLLGARARFTETLKPGEAVAWPHWGLGLGPNRPAGYSSIWHPFVVDPRAGTYTVAQSLDSDIEVEGTSETGGGLKSGTIKIEIVADPVAVNDAGPTVTGTLVGLDGKPVAGIEIVAFEGQKLLSQKFTTDERGQFQVPKAWRDADHMLTVVARDGAERLGWFDFFYNGHSDNGQKAADGSFKMVLLPLDRTVSGRLVDSDDNPLDRVSVQIEFLQHAVNFASTSWPGRKIGDVPLLLSAITNEDGKFELKVPTDASGTLRMRSVDWVGQRIPFKRGDAALGDTRAIRAAKVTGQVIDSRNGKPVAGASIGVQALKPDFQSGGWGDATTDQDGRYVIGGLPEGDYNVLLLDGAEKTLTAVAHDSVRLKSAETLQADFSLIVGKRLSGRVLDEKTGQPIAGCYVGYQGAARPRSGGAIEGSTTNAQGEFALFVPPGMSHVYVADAHETGSDSQQDVEVPQDRDPEPVTLKAGPKSAETGNVKIFIGAPSERLVSLKANRMPLQDALTELCRQAAVKLELDGEGLKSQGYTRNTPIFLELQNEPLGDAVKLVLKQFEKLDFTFDKDTLFVSAVEQVKARKQKAENGESDTDSKFGAISGTLIDDTTGMPVAGADIGCQLVAGKEGKVPKAVTTDRDGKYLLKEVPIGIYNVWVKKYDANPKLVAAADQGIDVKAGQTASSSLRLVEGRLLRGMVVNRGQPVEDVLIGCYSAARPQSTAHVQSAKSAADGSFQFLLPPGPAHLYTMSGGFTDKKRLYASENAIIPAKGDVPLIMLALTEKESLFGSTDWVARTTKGTEIVRRNAGAYVSGVVVDPDGKPIPKAVLIKAENWDERIWTDDKGEFNLKVDRGTQFVFAVHALGYNVWSGAPTTGDVLKIVLEPKVSTKAPANPGKQPDKTETKSDAQKGDGQDAVPPDAAGAAASKTFERVKPSVVVVTTTKLDDGGREAFGLTMGVIVDERGYILANGIILQKVDPQATRVKLDNGATYPADLVSVDLSTGLALLRINAKETLIRASLGGSADLKEGDPVVAASAVFVPKSAEVKSLVVANGTISGLHKDLEVGRKFDYTNLIQADIDTTPGGGPLWNAAGKLIGFTVLTRIADPKQAFAKEIDSILPFLKKEIPPVP